MTVSASISTSASITQVSGRKMVTPAAISRDRQCRAELCVERHQLGNGVGAQHLVRIVGLDGHHALAGAAFRIAAMSVR